MSTHGVDRSIETTATAPAAGAVPDEPSTEAEGLRRQVVALSAQLAGSRRGRSRYALELDTADGATAAATLRARAERAEASLAEQRRDSARAILGLRRQVTYWQLVARGLDHAEAARQAGLGAPLAGDEPAEETGQR